MLFLRRFLLALPFAVLPACFGMCGPSMPDAEASCVDDRAPSGGGPAIVLGSSESGDFERLRGGERLTLDFGPQGGQHFYYSIKAYGIDTDAQVFVSFFRDGIDPVDDVGEGGAGGGEGGAGGGAGGASSSTSTGAGEGGGYSEDYMPSEVVFFSEYFEPGECSGEWHQLENLFVQVPSTTPTSGLLRVELARCGEENCPYDEARGRYRPKTVLAADEVRISY